MAAEMPEAAEPAPSSGPALVDLPYANHDTSSVLYGHDVGTGLGRGRMDAIKGWNADINDKAPWIKLDLECVSHILGISTAGRSDRAEWVAQYRVQHSVNGDTWTEARPLSAPTNLVFDGNTDFVSRKDNFFADGGVQARYVRVNPVHWHGPTAAMRVGLIMQAPVNLPIPVTVTMLADLPSQAMPPLERKIPQPNSRIRATWDGYTGDMEEHLNNPDVRVLVPAIPPLKVLRNRKLPAVRWVMAPVRSSARTDGLVLNHWTKAVEKDADYAFAKLNITLPDVPTYTDDEYTRLIERHSGDWTRSDTDQLIDLVRRFDRRFTIVHDRFTPTPNTLGLVVERSLEDLQERYYKVSALLRAHRAKNDNVDDELANNVPYDAAHERLRRKQLSLLLSRTREDAEDEEFVVATMKRFNQRNKKDRDRDREIYEASRMYMKRKDTLSSSSPPAEADSEPLLKKVKKVLLKEDSAMSPAASVADFSYATPSVATPGGGLAGRKGAGATLNSARLTQPYQHMHNKTSKKVLAVYQSQGIIIDKLMPSSNVLIAVEEMREEVMDLIEIQRQVEKLEGEAKQLRARLTGNKAAQPAAVAMIDPTSATLMVKTEPTEDGDDH